MAPYGIYNTEECKIPFPFRMLLAAPSGFGKSSFCVKLLQNSERMMSINPQRIIYFHGLLTPELTALAHEDKRVFLYEGYDEALYLDKDKDVPWCVCIDDLMSSSKYDQISNLFTKYSRHLNIGVIFMTQNPYYRGNPSAVKHNKDILSNSTDIVLFHNSREVIAAMNIGKSAFFGKQFQLFKEAYADATSEKFTYLFMSFSPHTKPEFRLRSNIFYFMERTIVYLEK